MMPMFPFAGFVLCAQKLQGTFIFGITQSLSFFLPLWVCWEACWCGLFVPSCWTHGVSVFGLTLLQYTLHYCSRLEDLKPRRKATFFFTCCLLMFLDVLLARIRLSVSQSTALVQAEISQKLQDGLPRNFGKSLTVARSWILLNLPWLFLERCPFSTSRLTVLAYTKWISQQPLHGSL